MPKQRTESRRSTSAKGKPVAKAPGAAPARPGKRPPAAKADDVPFLASKVTARSQTTLPSGVRKALGIRAGDQIAYEIGKGRVVMRKVARGEEQDPALDGFLALLEDDVARNKERVVFATRGFADYLQELTAGIEVDYDAPIEGDFQL